MKTQYTDIEKRKKLLDNSLGENISHIESSIKDEFLVSARLSRW